MDTDNNLDRTKTSSTQSQLQLPPIYNFPPLYTRQPNTSIRERQLETWSNIILENANLLHIWQINKSGSLKHDLQMSNNSINLFINNHINRRVPQDFINDILYHMYKNNQLLPVVSTLPKNLTHSNNNILINKKIFDNLDSIEFFILWISLDSWSNIFLKWFDANGQFNKIITFYELTNNYPNEKFYLMPEELLYNILKILVKSGKATMLKDMDYGGGGGDLGTNSELTSNSNIDNYVAIKVIS